MATQCQQEGEILAFEYVLNLLCVISIVFLKIPLCRSMEIGDEQVLNRHMTGLLVH